MKKVIGSLLIACTLFSVSAFAQNLVSEKTIVSGTTFVVCDMTTPEKK